MCGTQPTFSYFDVGSEGAGNQEPERFYHGFVLGLIADQTDIYKSGQTGKAALAD